MTDSPGSTPLGLPFRSANTWFVAALLTANLMRYVGAEPSGSGTTFLLLNDTGFPGEELQRRFCQGIFERVSPKQYVEARDFLMREIERVRRMPGGSHVKA